MVLGVLIVLSMLAFPSWAEAHAIGLSSGEYRAEGMRVNASLSFARGEVVSLIPTLDENHDGHVSAAEVASHRAELEEKVLRRVGVRRGGKACEAALVDCGLTEQDGLLIVGRWTCGATEGPFDIELGILDDVARGHRHLAHIAANEGGRDEVLFGVQRSFSIEATSARAGGAGPSESAGAASAQGPDPASLGAMFRMGIEHILTGYDHLVFVLGLVLARARLRALLATVTAFTVAHSVTLAIAVLGVWSPSPRFIEPAIALSIAYVGVENFFVQDASKRWRVTFPFGLVHGFGFAGALQEIALPRGKLLPALAAFNLGVEAGQLAVLALLLPLLVLLRKHAWFERRGVPLTSGLVACAGVVWFVARVLEG